MKQSWKKKKKELKKYHSAYYVENRSRILKWTAEWKSRQRLAKPWKENLSSARYRATKHGYPFELTESWAKERWTGYCELTGLSFSIDKGRGVFSPSIDKIDPTKGYVPGNCRFILMGVNVFKHDGTDEQMYQMAEALVSHRRLKK